MSRMIMLLLALTLAYAPAGAEVFYKGETPRMFVASSSGGGYDAYAQYIQKLLDRQLFLPDVLKGGYRIAKDEPDDIEPSMLARFSSGGGLGMYARYVPKPIPGNPTAVVQSMPGVENPITANNIFKIDPAKYGHTGISPSDSVAGRIATSMLKSPGGGLFSSNVLQGGHKTAKDQPDDIPALIARALATPGVDAVLLNGGTRIAPREGASKVGSSMLEQRTDSFGELFPVLSYDEIGSAAIQILAFAGTAKDRAKNLPKAYKPLMEDTAFWRAALRAGKYPYYELKVHGPAHKKPNKYRAGATGLL